MKDDGGLSSWVESARTKLPKIDLKTRGGGLLIRSGRREVRIHARDVGPMRAEEVRERLEAGGSFLDLRSGLLHVEDANLVVHIKLRPDPQGLTPYQCALLAKALLERVEQDTWGGTAPHSALPLHGQQQQLAKEWSRALGIEVSTLGMHRLLKALERNGLLASSPRDTRELDLGLSLALIAEHFRLSSIGRYQEFLATPEDRDKVDRELGADIVRGLAPTIATLSGGWIEPSDVLINPEAMSELRMLLGPPMRMNSPGPKLFVRPARRVPLQLLSVELPDKGDQDYLNPILAVCEAVGSEEPVLRELATKIQSRWLQN